MFLNNKGRGKGRIISPVYRAWKTEAGYELNGFQVAPFDVRVRIKIMLDDRRQGDCDNRIKPVLDLLVTHRIIKGDSKKYVKGVSVDWEPVDECFVRITPYE